jgi:hypothetical protein
MCAHPPFARVVALTAWPLSLPAPGPNRRTLVLNQLDRLSCALCGSTFKALLCLHLDIILPLQARLICFPYYIAAILRLLLHCSKPPLPEVPRLCSRLGTPINPVHAIVIIVCCRVDRVLYLSCCPSCPRFGSSATLLPYCWSARV